MAGNKTKLKFAQAVQVLMEEKSLRKITVNDIVEKSSMTRQAFYYHFHDIYELLEWTCAYELFEGREETTAEEWFLELIDRLQDNRRFYRKIYQEFDERLLEQMLAGRIKEQIARDFVNRYPAEKKNGRDEENTAFLKNFLALSCANYLQKWICGYHCENRESMARHMNYLMGYIRNGYEMTEHRPLKIFVEKYA